MSENSLTVNVSPNCTLGELRRYIVAFRPQYHRSRNFRCRNIFMVCLNHKNKSTKYDYFTPKINHYDQHISYTRFQNAASYDCFAQDGSSF